MSLKMKLGMGLIWLAIFDLLFIMTLALPNEIVPLAIGGSVASVLGLFLMTVGAKK